MNALSNSFVSARNTQTHFVSGSSLMQVDQCIGSSKLFIRPTSQEKARLLKCRRSLKVRAGRDGGTGSGSGIFVGGFVLGGIIVGTLGCVFAPQISRALAGADRKDLMRKLPKFIYDEEKAIEKTRQVLSEKIAQLNSAIDDVSAQLHADDAPNGVSVYPDELEASI